MSDIIPKESAAQAKAWLVPELGSNVDSTHSQVHPDDDVHMTLPTAQGLETVFDTARMQGHEEGRRQGWAEGHAAGLQAGRAQAQEELVALRAVLKRLAAPVTQLDADLEAAVVALSLEIARQVVTNELHTHPEQILELLHRALSAFPAHAGVPWVRLNPADVKLLQEISPELEAGGVSLIADVSLQRGDLMLASGSDAQRAIPDRRWRPRSGHDMQSELDLRIEERWRQVMSRLFEEGSL